MRSTTLLLVLALAVAAACGAESHPPDSAAVASATVPSAGSAAAVSQPQSSAIRHRHPDGFSFELPEGWTTADREGNLVLVPPDADASRAEMYLTNSEAGYATANEPRVALELQQTVAALAPHLGRLRGIEPLNADAARAAVYTWEGRNPDTGQPVRVRCYVTTVNNQALVLIALGDRQQLELREAAVREIASSFGFDTTRSVAGAARGPAALPTPPARSSTTQSALTDGSPAVNQWLDRLSGMQLTRLSSYSSGSAGGYSSRATMYLSPDGRFAGSSSSSVSINVPGASGNSGGSNQQSGRWYLYRNQEGQSVLRLMREGNTEYEHNLLEDRSGQTWINGTRWYVTPPK